MSPIKISSIVALFSILAACGLSKKTEVREMSVRIKCIRNNMPMSSQSTYAIMQFFPADSIFTESFKVIEVAVSGSNGTWKGEKLDVPGFSGKGAKMLQNNVRDFDPSIGQPYNFVVIIQFESGETKRFEVQDVPLMLVS